jgi:hypothetical protein
MTSRRFSERIAIETRGEGEWSELCRRRASIDTQTLEITLPQDSQLQNLDHRDTRVRWFRTGDAQVINLVGIHPRPGRRPELLLQGYTEQFETQDEPTLVDLEGNEGVYET